MNRPVIGMCTALEQARWSVWDQPAMLLARSYVDAVQLAGGLVLMLPPDPHQTEDPEQVLDLIDGLVLTGAPTSIPRSTARRRTSRRWIRCPSVMGLRSRS